MTFTPISCYNNSILFKWGMFPNLIVMQEIPMTVSEMIAALEAVKVEKYVEEVLEDMSEEDLYCNFRLNGDMFNFRETDKTDEYEDKYREDYSIDTCVDNLL